MLQADYPDIFGERIVWFGREDIERKPRNKAQTRILDAKSSTVRQVKAQRDKRFAV